MVSDKINILTQVDVHTGTRAELVPWLGLSVSTLNTAVKKSVQKKNWKRKLQKIKQHAMKGLEAITKYIYHFHTKDNILCAKS
jgi:hypothetical protein